MRRAGGPARKSEIRNTNFETITKGWPRTVLASTISNLRKREVGNVKRDTLSTRPERPQGPLSDLERSEFYLREGERLAHMGSWSLRPDGIFDYWSPETFAIFDFDPSQAIPTLTQWLAVLPQEDRDLLAKTIDKMFCEDRSCRVIFPAMFAIVSIAIFVHPRS
jgi:hypothetical protein